MRDAESPATGPLDQLIDAFWTLTSAGAAAWMRG
jgi:hypothetical protein